ncbi:MAG: 6-phospho-beta-glucosidase, partial [Dactylosporangium sp.]|nr:6-phospho-beta-glucosidase [Dactylosporangium sp.]
MRLVVLGGGGFRVPLVYQALLSHGPGPRVREVVLHDVSQRRLRAMQAVLAGLADGMPQAPAVSATVDLD